jgi:hypothetical protein
MGLLIFLGGMSFVQTTMSQDQTTIDGIETPAPLESPSLATVQTEDSDANQSPLLSLEQLEELVGPVALYPDDLIGIIIPASTYPLQVVQAARYLKKHEQDPDLQINDEWDDSIVALLNYPEILKMMDEDLDWTWKLGAAVVNQQDDVMDAIQQFRQRALAAGNLDSDDKQIVSHEGGTIEVKPADPEVIYVPIYVPKEVIVYQTVPVYSYYPIGYPVYYYPYGPDYRFRTSFFWGLSSAFYIGWNTHYIHAFPYDYYRHPYYGSSFYFDYYGHYYQRSRRHHHRDVNNHVNVRNRAGAGDHRWRPSRRTSGARPSLANNSTQNQRTGSRNRGATNNQRNSNTSKSSDHRLASTQSTLQTDQKTRVQRRTDTNRTERTGRNNQRNGKSPDRRLVSTQSTLQTDQKTRVQRRTNTSRAGITARNDQRINNTSRLPVKRLANTKPTLKPDQSTRVQRRTNTSRVGITTRNDQRINNTSRLPVKRLSNTKPTLKPDQSTRVQRRTNTNRIEHVARNDQRINNTSRLPVKRLASTKPTLKTDQNTRVQRKTNTNRTERSARNNQRSSNTNSLPTKRSASTLSRPRSSKGASTRTRNRNSQNSGLQTLARADTAANSQSRSQSYRGFSTQNRSRKIGAGNQTRSRPARTVNSHHR